MKNTLIKSEKLSSKRVIDELFKEGKSFTEYPIKFLWMPVSVAGEAMVQILITVPKRNFKKAVDRNRIKRQISSAYRTNKTIIYKQIVESNVGIAVAIVYLGKDQSAYANLEDKIILSLQRLAKGYGETDK